jgi:hypothetical protein
MSAISNHLEGCLLFLTPSPPSIHKIPPKPFGGLICPLKESGILTQVLADQLWKFNQVVNVSSKHFNAYIPTIRLDERTFSIYETACALVIMRKLSIELFGILKTKGIISPQEWPNFKDEWLSWNLKKPSPE